MILETVVTHLVYLQVLTDIPAVVLAFELYLLGFLHALCQSLGLGGAIGTYGYDTTTAGKNLTVLVGCAGVEYDTAFHVVDARDGESLLV
jgi:hypothetical protein